MKIKYNSSITLYVGFYKSTPLAADENKDLVKNYLEFHRGLKSREYYIEKIESDSVNVDISVYENILLRKYRGYYLTQMDIRILDQEFDSLLGDFNTTINTMMTLGVLSKLTKSLEDNAEIFVKAVEVMKDYQESDSTIRKLEKKFLFAHPVFHSEINKYLQIREIYVAMYEEIYTMDSMFKNRIMEDD